ncbi:MAG TPA: hypothetical protein GXZ24_02405 [Firmicutes bacterium]|jgi:hypothetical protein|nr:hypothetical protein [Bacillota bacterium]
MEQVNYHKELEKEMEKLNKLVDKALKNVTPLVEDEAFMEQNRKVDALIVKIQKEKELNKKKRGF